LERARALKWLRAAAVLAAAAISAGCVRDTFAAPFSSASPFVPWIPDPWRSAYPWACAATVAFAAARRHVPREPSAGALSLAGIGALALARVAAPASYEFISRLIPESIRDDVLVPCVWAGLAFETWLPLFVLAALGYEALTILALHTGEGWPHRGTRSRGGNGDTPGRG